jgi:hypothetical protein
MRVKRVLKSYVTGQGGHSPVASTPRTDLTTNLSEVSRTNRLRFQLCCAALVILFTVSSGLIVRLMNDPGELGALFAFTGISFIVLVACMIWVWKQKVTADVVVLLARHLHEKDIRGVIEVLFNEL